MCCSSGICTANPRMTPSGRLPVFGEVFPTSNISGAAFLIKTDVFRQAGWFDESYFFTPEDIALSTKLREAGYGVYVDRGAEVVHKWKATASRISPAVRPAAIRGSLMFFSRGSSAKYFLLAAPVWLAEFSKYLQDLPAPPFPPVRRECPENAYLQGKLRRGVQPQDAEADIH